MKSVKLSVRRSDTDEIVNRLLDIIGVVTAFALILFTVGVVQQDYAAILLAYLLAIASLYAVVAYGASRKVIREEIPDILYFRAGLYEKLGRRFSGIVVRE